MIGNADPRVIAEALDVHAHNASPRTVPNRVVHQIAQQYRQKIRMPFDKQRC